MTETLTPTLSFALAPEPAIFEEVYALAERAAGLGKLDPDRLVRAREYIETGIAEEKFAEYQTTVSTCQCPDNIYRSAKTGPCKHRIAMMLLVRAGEEALASER